MPKKSKKTKGGNKVDYFYSINSRNSLHPNFFDCSSLTSYFNPNLFGD